MLGYEKEQRTLTKEQKLSVGLLSIGTFLEYFDLMLYVHMAILLNELFFPKFDPFINSLLTAFTFCSTYLLRPFAALIFGWIGDNIGRKATVIITTVMMSFSCFIIFVLPTYSTIGITASVVMIICRIIQGMSSIGEIVGVRLYLTEMIKPPIQYFAVSLVSSFALIGGLAALVVGWFCISMFFNWRLAFLFGSFIGLIGGIIRTKLRETLEFVDAKRRVKHVLNDMGQNVEEVLSHSPMYKEKVNYKTSLAYLFILSLWPANFFLTYIYCGDIFKTKFQYSPEQVIQNNIYVTIFNLIIILFLAFLSKKVYPFKILKIRIIIFLTTIPLGIYLLSKVSSSKELLLLQLFLVLTSCCEDPATSILYRYFPVFKRFTYSSFLHAVAKLLVYVITTFGIIFISEYFNQWGLLIIVLPLGLLFYYGIHYFETLTLASNHRPTQD